MSAAATVLAARVQAMSFGGDLDALLAWVATWCRPVGADACSPASDDDEITIRVGASMGKTTWLLGASGRQGNNTRGLVQTMLREERERLEMACGGAGLRPRDRHVVVGPATGRRAVTANLTTWLPARMGAGREG